MILTYPSIYAVLRLKYDFVLRPDGLEIKKNKIKKNNLSVLFFCVCSRWRSTTRWSDTGERWPRQMPRTSSTRRRTTRTWVASCCWKTSVTGSARVTGWRWMVVQDPVTFPPPRSRTRRRWTSRSRNPRPTNPPTAAAAATPTARRTVYSSDNNITSNSQHHNRVLWDCYISFVVSSVFFFFFTYKLFVFVTIFAFIFCFYYVVLYYPLFFVV